MVCDHHNQHHPSYLNNTVHHSSGWKGEEKSRSPGQDGGIGPEEEERIHDSGSKEEIEGQYNSFESNIWRTLTRSICNVHDDVQNLIRILAAEELKKEQARKAAERARILAERTGTPKDIENANEAELVQILKEYHERMKRLEGEKYDLEYETAKKDFEKKDLAAKVNDVRGKL